MSRKERLHNALFQELMPEQLIIDDESHTHHVPKDGESHFKIIIVSKLFQSLSRIARHRLVQTRVAQEFQTGLHALSLHLYTPEEWTKAQKTSLTSPVCRGGKHQETL